MQHCNLMTYMQRKPLEAVLVDTCLYLPGQEREYKDRTLMGMGDNYWGERATPAFCSGGKYYYPILELLDVYYDWNDDVLARFEVDGKWGYVRLLDGKVAIAPTWPYADWFYNGAAIVNRGGKMPHPYDIHSRPAGGLYGFIDEKGNAIVDCLYEQAQRNHERNNNVFYLCKDGKWGALNAEKTVVIPFEWDMLEPPGIFHDLENCTLGILHGSEASTYTVMRQDGHIQMDFLDERPRKYRKAEGGAYSEYTIFCQHSQYGLMRSDSSVVLEAQYTHREITVHVDNLLKQSEELDVPCIF